MHFLSLSFLVFSWPPVAHACVVRTICEHRELKLRPGVAFARGSPHRTSLKP